MAEGRLCIAHTKRQSTEVRFTPSPRAVAGSCTKPSRWRHSGSCAEAAVSECSTAPIGVATQVMTLMPIGLLSYYALNEPNLLVDMKRFCDFFKQHFFTGLTARFTGPALASLWGSRTRSKEEAAPIQTPGFTRITAVLLPNFTLC